MHDCKHLPPARDNGSVLSTQRGNCISMHGLGSCSQPSAAKPSFSAASQKEFQSFPSKDARAVETDHTLMDRRSLLHSCTNTQLLALQFGAGSAAPPPFLQRDNSEPCKQHSWHETFSLSTNIRLWAPPSSHVSAIVVGFDIHLKETPLQGSPTSIGCSFIIYISSSFHLSTFRFIFTASHIFTNFRFPFCLLSTVCYLTESYSPWAS